MVEHWVKLRVDTPGQVVARLDDAAKQLLTVTGLLQGILIAIVKFAPEAMKDFSGWSIAAMIGLVISALFAMLTLCVQSGYLDTHPLYEAFRRNPTQDGALRVVDTALERWCKSHDVVRFWKRRLLGVAMLSLVVSMSFSVVCVSHAMHNHTGGSANSNTAAATR